ncbi:hypothetical protein AcV5_000231 [Taiwanofungus camphoratus]|nr:hypothetical protein AcV5_000231 [Antrodia cinnamomea]
MEMSKTDLTSCEVRGQWDEGAARLRCARRTSSKWLLHPGPLAACREAGIKERSRPFCQLRGEGRARLRRASPVGPSSTRQPLTAPKDDTDRTEGRSPRDRPPEMSKMDLASCEVRGQWDEGAARLRRAWGTSGQSFCSHSELHAARRGAEIQKCWTWFCLLRCEGTEGRGGGGVRGQRAFGAQGERRVSRFVFIQDRAPLAAGPKSRNVGHGVACYDVRGQRGEGAARLRRARGTLAPQGSHCEH